MELHGGVPQFPLVHHTLLLPRVNAPFSRTTGTHLPSNVLLLGVETVHSYQVGKAIYSPTHFPQN